MDLPTPSSDKTQVVSPQLPIPPAIFASMLPTPVPPLDYRPGVLPLFENFLHNWKLKQMVLAAQREAELGAFRLQQTQTQFAHYQEVMMAGFKQALAIRQVQHDERMLDLAEQKSQAEIVTIQWQNLQAQIEAQKAQLELQQMMKELGFKPPPENGDQG